MAAEHLGDFLATGTVRVWHSTAISGIGPSTLSGTAKYVLVNGSATKITAGVSLSVDMGGGIVGLHRLTVDVAAAGLVAGDEATVVLEGTLGTEPILVPFQFSVVRVSALANLDVLVSTRLATAGYTAPLSAAGVRAAVGLVTANLDTQLDALPTNAELATALGAADDAVLAAIAALNNISSAGAQSAAAAALSAYGAALQATLVTVASYVDTEVAGVKAKTDLLSFDAANHLNVRVRGIGGSESVIGTGRAGTDEWRDALEV